MRISANRFDGNAKILYRTHRALPFEQEDVAVMAEEQTKNASADSETGDAAASDKRQRSTIEFPYGDLDDAVKFAAAVHTVGGQSCSVEQVAGHLKQAPTSGAFRLRLSYPRIFGFTTTERGEIQLTELGQRVVDAQQEASARVEAFLNVPLYRAIYEKYKGYTLPPPAALEREMAKLGVSTKQTDKARQAFDRSAKQAGFFWAGTDRLVLPVTNKPPESKPLEQGTPGAGYAERRNPPKFYGGGGSGGGGREDLDPLIAALIQKLPGQDDDFPAAARARWLQMMSMAFDEAWGAVGDIEIKIGH